MVTPKTTLVGGGLPLGACSAHGWEVTPVGAAEWAHPRPVPPVPHPRAPPSLPQRCHVPRVLPRRGLQEAGGWWHLASPKI